MAHVMTMLAFRGAAAVAAIAALSFPFGSEADAQASAWHHTERGAVRLISAAGSIGRDRELAVGVEVRLRSGWKTYWRHPGQSGFPPQFDWRGSANVADAEVIWPAPERFQLGGLDSIGYTSRVILPVRLKLAEPGRRAEARLRLTYAVCRDICVPEEASLVLAVPVGPGMKSAFAADIERFAGQAPRPGHVFGWRVEYVGLHDAGPDGSGRPALLMVSLVSARSRFAAPDLLAEGGSGESFGRASVKLLGDARRAHFVIPVSGSVSRPENGRGLTLTALDGRRAASFTVEIGGPQH